MRLGSSALETFPFMNRLCLYSVSLQINMAVDKVNVREKLGLFSEYWSPKVIGELNGQHIKVVKLHGEFVWHHHEEEDEMFMVLTGVLKMEFRDRTIEIKEGEFIIVPRKTEHRPVADDTVEILLFEPASTLNTGNVINERTKEQLENI